LTDGSVVQPRVRREKEAEAWLFIVSLVTLVQSAEGYSHALSRLHAAEPERWVWLEQIGLPLW
jgi:hypothetical protein